MSTDKNRKRRQIRRSTTYSVAVTLRDVSMHRRDPASIAAVTVRYGF